VRARDGIHFVRGPSPFGPGFFDLPEDTVTTDAGAASRVRGMQDLLPAEMDRVRSVEAAFAGACRAWGYREVRTPVIEPLHLFTAAGTLSPKTLDSVYSFLDWDGWSGERVVLRPDSTIPVARLYAEHYAPGDTARLFYRQNVFRFTDDGSSREEWQCGVELVGDTGPAGDVEIVLLAREIVTKLGLGTPAIRVSHAGMVRTVLAAASLDAVEQSAAYDRLLDGDITVVDEIESRLPSLNAPLRLLFDVEGAGGQYLANVRAALLSAIPALATPLDELGFVVEALEAAGVAPIVQAVLARSFEYYSGLVFKIHADGERIVSGGRYDGLLELIGGTRVPASGFALYVTPTSRLLASAPANGVTRTVDVAPTARTADTIAAAHTLAQELRAHGLSVRLTNADASTEPLVLCEPSRGMRLRLGGRERPVESTTELLAALERAP